MVLPLFHVMPIYAKCIKWLLMHFPHPVPKKNFHSVLSSSDSTQVLLTLGQNHSTFVPQNFLKHPHGLGTIPCTGDSAMNETCKNPIPHRVLILVRQDGQMPLAAMPAHSIIHLFKHSFIQAVLQQTVSAYYSGFVMC